MHYFVRVNGASWPVDPGKPRCFVPDEPPNRHPVHGFNYARYCLAHGIVRIGWPDTGDLTAAPGTGALANCYRLDTLEPHQQGYLRAFAEIAPASTVLMPEKDRPGEVYIGTVMKAYWYHHAIPVDPYECAHRVGVEWDRDGEGVAVVYRAGELGIGIKGGFWTRAFQVLEEIPTGREAIAWIGRARGKARVG